MYSRPSFPTVGLKPSMRLSSLPVVGKGDGRKPWLSLTQSLMEERRHLVSHYFMSYRWTFRGGWVIEMINCVSLCMAESAACYEAVVKALVKGGGVDRAMAILEDMVVKGVRPNVSACNAIMNAVARGPEWSKALEMMEAMGSMGVTPNEIRWVVMVQINRHIDAMMSKFDACPD